MPGPAGLPLIVKAPRETSIKGSVNADLIGAGKRKQVGFGSF